MIARRFAKALVNIAMAENLALRVKKDMVGILELTRQKKYYRFLTDRMVLDKDKAAIFETLTPSTRDFLRLVIKSRREHYLQLMALEYIKMINQKLDTEDVEVATKTPLTATEKQRITIATEKLINKKHVNIGFIVDKAILGGVRIKYGNKTIDGTVSGILLKFLETLTKG